MKVLHVLANSPPDINGYAVRTQMLLQYQNEIDGINNLGLTSPWYPDRDSMVDDHEKNGVGYLRTLHPSRKNNSKISHKLIDIFTPKPKDQKSFNKTESKKKFIIIRLFNFIYLTLVKIPQIGWKVIEEKILIKYFTKRIIEVAKQHNVDIIHAHTPYRVGLPALKAARRLNLPFVYEMRGMWEETAVANGRWRRNGPAYLRFQNFENKVLTKADSVICISETLKKEAISRGVDPSKITVVTNAVERNMLENKTESSALKSAVKALNCTKSTKVVGYIGSLREMEGVDFTALGVSKLIEKGHDVRLFVLSGTSGQSQLQDYCEGLGISDKSVIMGPVPHEEVARFYDLIDIFVVSRPDSKVTRLVTPLKPFEAMLMGKVVVATNLPAIAEILQHQETGLLFEPENIESLVSSLENCLEDPAICEELGKAAQKWVLENRTWESVVKNTLNAYSIAKQNQ